MAGVSVRAATAEMERAFSILPGFRFHPTDQELVNCFLRRKLLGLHIHFNFIPVMDVYRFQPDEIPGKSFSPSIGDPGARVEWYFFAPRGRKYPTGLRMERATLKGFWKSTGKDRPVMHNGLIVGMKKTLVFHIGRAPCGTRTDWVMHEYRLHGHRNHHIQDTYALCRVFNKSMVSPSMNLYGVADTDEDLMQFVPGGDSVKDLMQPVLDCIGTDKDLIQVEAESDGADTENDFMQSILGDVGADMDLIQVEAESDGADTENDFMQSILDDVGADMDLIQVESESDAANVNKDLMQYMLGGGTDKNPIRFEFVSNEADTDKDMMQFTFDGMGTYKNPIQIESEVDGVDTDKGEKQFITDGDDTGNGEMQILADGANNGQEGMLHVTGGASVDEVNSENSWYTRYLAEEDNSWTQFPFDDLWFTSDYVVMSP